jgi:hypothetical protein
MEGEFFSFTLPSGSISDPDNDSLSYQVSFTEFDGYTGHQEFPLWLGWLSFDAGTMTISGTPPATLPYDPYYLVLVTINVSDGRGGQTNVLMIFTLELINQLPTIKTPLPIVNMVRGSFSRQQYSLFMFSDSDPRFHSYYLPDVGIGPRIEVSASEQIDGSPLPTWLGIYTDYYYYQWIVDGEPPLDAPDSMMVKLRIADNADFITDTLVIRFTTPVDNQSMSIASDKELGEEKVRVTSFPQSHHQYA